MSFPRRWVSLFMGVCCAAMLVWAGCAQKQSGGTELKLWTFTDDALVTGLLKDFEAAHPGVTVKHRQLSWDGGLEQILVALSGGDAPDVGELGSTWVARFAADGQLADLTDGFSDLAGQLTLMDVGRYDGKVVALPWLVGSRALFYNKTLFEQAGLDPEAPPATWAELLAAARAVDALDERTGGFGTNSGEKQVLFKRFLPFLWSAGGELLSEDGATVTLDTPQARQALDFMVALADTGPVMSQGELDQLFRDGMVGMMISGAWNLTKIAAEAPDLDYGVALVPAAEDDPRVTPYSFAGAEVLVRYQGSKHPQLADELLRYLMAMERMAAVTRELPYLMPAYQSAADDGSWVTDPRQKVFARQMLTSRHTPQVAEWVRMEEVINLQVEKALMGGDPAQALQEAQAQVQAILDEDG